LLPRLRVVLRICTISAAFAYAFPVTPSHAVSGGDNALGDKRVVALIVRQNPRMPRCSAVVIKPKVVATAAHCVAAENGVADALEFLPTELAVSRPGVSIYTDALGTRARVVQVIIPPGYTNSWNPAIGDMASQQNDIAFIILDREISSQSFPIASIKEIAQLKAAQKPITHLGYGLQSADTIDGSPYLLRLSANITGASRYGVNHQASEVNTLSTRDTAAESLCAGDSGGPWFATIKGVEKLVAISSGGGGCLDTPSGASGILGTAISPYLKLLAKIAKQ
jgi:secreted trypsin-like serine protease